MIRSALDGHYPIAQQLNLLLLDVHHYLYVEGNPVGIKAAMEILGFCSKEVRLPLAQMAATNYEGLKKEMAQVEKFKVATS